MLNAPGNISNEQLFENLPGRLQQSSSKGGVDLVQAAHTVQTRYPELRKSILSEADLAVEGRLILPGTMNQPYFVGDPIDWYTNPVNDKEFVWVLNRMPHWITLGQAALVTGEDRYGARIVSEWRDWIKRCALPRPTLEKADPTSLHHLLTDCHPWRLLEAGIRGYQWPEVMKYLAAAGLLTADLTGEIAASLQAHGWYLSTFAPGLHPLAHHNHYVMEMLGLLAIACTFPELPEAEPWRVQAMRELERAIEAQITGEGGQIEGCPAYHNLCVILFSRALALARENDFEMPAAFLEKYRRSVDYMLQAARPTAQVVPWGDSDSSWELLEEAVFKAYQTTGDADLLRIVAELAGKGAMLRCSRRHAWETNLEDIEREIEKPPSKFPALFQWHHSLDQVTARSDWSRQALSLFFACRLPHNGHAHIDLNGFDFSALGKVFVIDPGRYTYREDPDRYEFKRAASHSTLLVDENDPYAYLATWSFGPQKPARVIAARSKDGLVTMVGEHHNYHPAVHRRTLVLVGKLCVVVLDEIRELRPDQTVQIYFHLDSTQVAWDQKSHRAATQDPGPNLVIVAAPELEGSLLPGRISERMDCARPSTRLRLSDSGGPASRTYFSLLIPYEDGNSPALRVESDKAPGVLPAVLVQGRKIDLEALRFFE